MDEQDSLQTASFLRFAESKVRNLICKSGKNKFSLTKPNGLCVSSRYGVACVINVDGGVSIVQLTEKSFIDLKYTMIKFKKCFLFKNKFKVKYYVELSVTHE